MSIDIDAIRNRYKKALDAKPSNDGADGCPLCQILTLSTTDQ